MVPSFVIPKDLNHQVTRAPNDVGVFEYQNVGTGQIIGLETLLRYNPDEKFFGWIAYTLSESLRQDCPTCPTRLFQYDQTHNLIMLGSYRLGNGWEVGARFRIVTGPLVTPTVGQPLPAIYEDHRPIEALEAVFERLTGYQRKPTVAVGATL